MTTVADQPRFRFDPGELKIPEFVEAVRKTMLGISALDVVRAGTSPAFWIAAAKTPIELLQRLVDIPLADVLVGGWKTHRQFKRYTDRSQFPPDKISVVPLSTHHIKSTHEPYIELSVNGAPAGRIPFQLELDVTVEAATLVIQDGKFKRLEPGRARLTGTLKCAGEVISQRTSRDYAWTDGISFGEGIPIEAVV
jgi:hypothetical protein